jgi:very-short-patch-repair endonuclease
LEDYREHGMTITRSDRWPDHGLVVEVDTWTYHGTRAAFGRDRARDRAERRAGLRVARVTGDEIERDGPALMAEIAALLAPEHPALDAANPLG